MWIKLKQEADEVLFVRTPSSGQLLAGGIHELSTKIILGQLLAATGCPGIYFKDYPAIAHLECPEWSHLSPEQAVVFTKNLIKILREEKGWTFKN